MDIARLIRNVIEEDRKRSGGFFNTDDSFGWKKDKARPITAEEIISMAWGQLTWAQRMKWRLRNFRWNPRPNDLKIPPMKDEEYTAMVKGEWERDMDHDLSRYVPGTRIIQNWCECSLPIHHNGIGCPLCNDCSNLEIPPCPKHKAPEDEFF